MNDEICYYEIHFGMSDKSKTSERMMCGEMIL